MNVLTLASEDQSFEYHVELSEVSKIVFIERETPAKTLRVIRLLNEVGNPISSLILASDDDSDHYHELIEKFGSEIQL